MRSRILVLIATVACVAAEPLDKARVREAIPMPELWPALNWRFNGQQPFCHAPYEELLVSRQVTVGEKVTRDHPNDADAWRQLARLYACAKNSKGERGALDRAAALYRKQIEAEPNCGLTMARCADCLEMPAGREEAELLLRAAVELSPGEWECWVLLGDFVMQDARSSLVKCYEFVRDNETTPAEYLASDTIGKTEARRTRDRYQEAQECYERAVAVAPDVADVYVRRVICRSGREECEPLLRAILGAPAGSPPVCFSFRTMLPDLERAAAISRFDPFLVGIIPVVILWDAPEAVSWLRSVDSLRYAESVFDPSADTTKPTAEEGAPPLSAEIVPHPKPALNSVVDHLVLRALSQSESSNRPKQVYKDLRSLAAEDQRKVNTYLTRLEALAADEQSDSAAAAAWAAGFTCFIAKDWTRAERNLRHAFRLDPKFEPAAELLFRTYVAAGDAKGLKEFSTAVIAAKESLRNGFLLAKAYHYIGLDDNAVAVAESALKHDSDDLAGNLLLISLLLRRSDAIADARAGLLLGKTIRLSRGSVEKPYSKASVAILAAAYAALTDDMARARNNLELLSSNTEVDDSIRKLMDAISPPVAIAPPLAIGLQPESLTTGGSAATLQATAETSWPPITPAKKALIRKTIEFPKITAASGFIFTLTDEYELVSASEGSPSPEKVAAAEKAVSSKPDDVDLLSVLADLYFDCDQDGNAAAAKAVDLYRHRMSQDPQNGRLCTLCALRLPWATTSQLDDAEQLLRKAVKLAPDDWRNWTALAKLLRARAWAVQNVGQNDAAPSSQSNPRNLTRDVASASLHTAEQYFSEVRECLDRAVKVAPREPKVYLARSHAAFLDGPPPRKDINFAEFCGIEPNPAVDGACADLWKAVDLAPEEGKTLSYAIFAELMTHLPTSTPTAGVNLLEGLPARSAAAVEKGIARLQAVADKKGNDAVMASIWLGGIAMLQSKEAEADRRFAKAVELDPACESNRDIYLLALLEHGKKAEALAAGREYLKRKDCAHSRAILAKILEYNGDWAEAERTLEIALQRDPVDLMCNHMLAASLLRKESQNGLKRASQLLDVAAKALRADSNSKDLLDQAVLRLAYFALIGDEKKVHDLLRSLKPEQRDDVRVAALVKILEQPEPTPAK